jgi:hypothetical protein
VQAVLILRQLWRLRGLVITAAVLAIAVGGWTAFHPGLPPHSRQYTVGVATARALVDTPSSQVVDLGLKQDANAGVLPARAVLLANLLTTSPLKDKTARRAGVPANRLIAVADTPNDSGVPVGKPLATGTTLKPTDPEANVVTAHTDVDLPLLTINTQAPDPRTAARLADAALSVLEAHLAAVVADESVPADRRLVVKRLGDASTGSERRGPSPALGLVAALGLFGLACGLLVLGATLARDWHAIAEAGGEARPLATRPVVLERVEEPAPAVRELPLRPVPDEAGTAVAPRRVARWDD